MRLTSAKIYLLDDDPVILKGAEEALQDLGTVQAAALWSELASSLLRSNGDAPSLLVCDLDMPGIKGADFCKIVQKHSPNTRILIFTSSPERAPDGVSHAVVCKSEGFGALAKVARRLVE